MVWAWMLWSLDAVEYEEYYGLGMDALVVVVVAGEEDVVVVVVVVVVEVSAPPPTNYLG